MFDDFLYSENQNDYTLYRNLIDDTGLLEISTFFFTINLHPYVSYIL